MSYHTIILVGNLGRDAEMRYLANGKAVTNFSVAVSDGFGEQKRTIWIRVSAWEKTAEACAALKKGAKVLVEGRLVADAQTGGPKVYDGKSGPAASFEVSANRVVFLSPRTEGENAPSDAGDTDLPF